MPSTAVQRPPRRQTADLPAALTRLRGIAERWRTVLQAERVILFGSVKDSDIDILVVAATIKPLYQRLATARRSVRDLRYGLPISPLMLTPEELQERLERRDPFITEIIATGIELTARPSESWRRYALRDWRRARIMARAGDLQATGMFLQQAVEKYLKGFLMDQGWALRKTHELDLLLEEAIKHQPRLAAYRDVSERMSSYYLIDRYPNVASGLEARQIDSDAAMASALILTIFPDEALPRRGNEQPGRLSTLCLPTAFQRRPNASSELGGERLASRCRVNQPAGYSALSASRSCSSESGVISSTVASKSTLACTISRAFRTVSSSGAS